MIRVVTIGAVISPDGRVMLDDREKHLAEGEKKIIVDSVKKRIRADSKYHEIGTTAYNRALYKTVIENDTFITVIG